MAMDLDYAPSYHLLCPKRYCEETKLKVTIFGGQPNYIINNALCFSEPEDEKSNANHFLLPQIKEEEVTNIYCSLCWKGLECKTYYICNHCNEYFHKECVESPSMIQSSDHPKHPLQLLWPVSPNNTDRSPCRSCGDKGGNPFYCCYICEFIIHPICARKPTSLTIDNQKRHEHTLHYLARRSAMVCDVCGLDDHNSYLYACLLCDFIVHKWCIYLPNVIKVARHNHRLVFTPNLPYKEWTDCGVCHANINGKYGKYSCNKGCAYAVHTKCAMRRDVCDGKELEGEPEEVYENIKMFEWEGNGVIRHLSHRHHQMRLGRVSDETKHCQSCILPFYEDGDVYQCMQCEDFIFHELCAYLPRVKQYLLHVHSLILISEHTTSGFKCTKCGQYSCGFRYACQFPMCRWELDTLCASICEPFYHQLHPHPLFITLSEFHFTTCSICYGMAQQPLNCVVCNFFVCFHCATLPHKVRYEHDEHLLILSNKEDISIFEVYWCEICEEDIDGENRLYACKECKTTLHIECLLGTDPYMKPGTSSKVLEETILTLPNTHSTRPICKECKERCPYKVKMESSSKDLFCSIMCFESYAGRESGRRKSLGIR